MSDEQDRCGYPLMDCTLRVYVTKCEDRIEELEAKLAKAVEALEQIASHRKKCHEYDDDVGHERREFDVEDMIIMEYAARTTLAALKGQDDEVYTPTQ